MGIISVSQEVIQNTFKELSGTSRSPLMEDNLTLRADPTGTSGVMRRLRYTLTGYCKEKVILIFLCCSVETGTNLHYR